MVSPLKRIFAEGDAKAGDKPKGLMPLLDQGGKLTWWRPLAIPFRPLVIIFNMLLRSHGGRLLPLSRPQQSPQLVQTNEQVYEIEWDQLDRPTKVIVHRKVNEL